MKQLLLILFAFFHYSYSHAQMRQYTCYVEGHKFDTSLMHNQTNIYLPLININFDKHILDSLCRTITQQENKLHKNSVDKEFSTYWKQNKLIVKYLNKAIKSDRNDFVYKFMINYTPENAHDFYIFYYSNKYGLILIYFPFANEDDLSFKWNHCFAKTDKSLDNFKLKKIKKRIIKSCKCDYHFSEIR